MKNYKKLLVPVSLGVLGLFLFSSCSVSIPEGVTAVQNFKSDQYLGKWYEIARFDSRFEKNLDNVTAEYTKKDETSLNVKNRGHDYVKDKWKESVGEARFVNSKDEGRLKVSFFKPIWAGYNVIAVDEDYKYALVAGNDLDYLWIMSREKTIPDSYKKKYLEKAKSLGFDTSKLIWVKHD